MDDLPVFEEAPLRAVDFAPRTIRPRGRSGPIVAGTWVGGLVALVGIGVFGGTPARDPGKVAGIDGQVPAQVASPEAQPSPDRIALAVTDIVKLEAPAPARVEVTTPQVQVAGSVLVRAARVEISLEARGNRVIDHISVDTSDPRGGIRPELAPKFGASFDLPYPRPNGTMWVVVTVYDERGMPLGGTRRPFVVGPLLEPEPISRSEGGDGQG